MYKSFPACFHICERNHLHICLTIRKRAKPKPKPKQFGFGACLLSISGCLGAAQNSMHSRWIVFVSNCVALQHRFNNHVD